MPDRTGSMARAAPAVRARFSVRRVGKNLCASLRKGFFEMPPLIGAAMVFAAGVFLGDGAAADWPFWIALALSIAAFFLLPRRRRLAAFFAVCALGAVRSYGDAHPSLPAAGTYQISAVVADNILSGENGQWHTRLSSLTLDGASVSGEAYWSFYTELPEGLIAGSRVSFQGRVYLPSEAENPGGFDFRTYLRQNGMCFGVYGAERCQVEAGAPSLFYAPARARQALSQGLCAAMGEDAGAYAAAMLLGERSLMDREDRQAFSRMGVAHLLSVSGLHVGILSAMAEALLRRLRLGRRLRFVLKALLLIFYALLTGGSGATVRAVIFALLFDLGRLCCRRSDGLVTLSASAFLILLVRPAQLYAAGFQLTFGAMLGMLTVTPRLLRRVRSKGKFLRKLWRSVCYSAGAQLGILLPLCSAFQQVPLTGIVLNMLLIPFSSVLMGLYLLTLALLPVAAAAGLAGSVAALATRGMVAAVQALDTLPGGFLWTAQPAWFGWVGMGLLLFVLRRRCRWKKLLRAFIACAAALCAVLSMVPVPHAGTDWVQLSVGDADAAVLRDEGMVVAVDAGEDDTLAVYLRQRRLSLDALILTHLHMDHAGGIAALTENRIPVRVCYLPWGADLAAADEEALALLEALKGAGTEIRTLSRGDTLELPSGEMRVLWPLENGVRKGADANTCCMATLWTLHGVTLLSAADLTTPYENYAAYPADVLKVGHHGAENATGEVFAAAVSPRVALLSSGDEEKLASVAERLPEVEIWFTGLQGSLTLHFAPEGETGTYTVESFLRE